MTNQGPNPQPVPASSPETTETQPHRCNSKEQLQPLSHRESGEFCRKFSYYFCLSSRLPFSTFPLLLDINPRVMVEIRQCTVVPATMITLDQCFKGVVSCFREGEQKDQLCYLQPELDCCIIPWDKRLQKLKQTFLAYLQVLQMLADLFSEASRGVRRFIHSRCNRMHLNYHLSTSDLTLWL